MKSPEWLERTELLLGESQLSALAAKHVLVVGLGGVGAYAAEMICRAGVGKMTIVDGDVVQASNRNRQLLALTSNQGAPKAELMAQRLLEINPQLDLRVNNEYLRDERMIEILDLGYDYVVDAIDTLAPKIFLIYHSVQKDLRIASSMGSGGKTDPTQIQVTDISKSYNCKLASTLRKRLHRLGIYSGVKVVFSPEQVNKDSVALIEGEPNKKSTVGTISYMPPAFGCFLAAIVIKDLIQ